MIVPGVPRRAKRLQLRELVPLVNAGNHYTF
jgi:hypothetical protein